MTLRLRRVLGTSFTDPATTDSEAVQTLHLYNTLTVSPSYIQTSEQNGTDDNDDDWSD